MDVAMFLEILYTVSSEYFEYLARHTAIRQLFGARYTYRIHKRTMDWWQVVYNGCNRRTATIELTGCRLSRRHGYSGWSHYSLHPWVSHCHQLVSTTPAIVTWRVTHCVSREYIIHKRASGLRRRLWLVTLILQLKMPFSATTLSLYGAWSLLESMHAVAGVDISSRWIRRRL